MKRRQAAVGGMGIGWEGSAGILSSMWCAVRFISTGRVLETGFITLCWSYWSIETTNQYWLFPAKVSKISPLSQKRTANMIKWLEIMFLDMTQIAVNLASYVVCNFERKFFLFIYIRHGRLPDSRYSEVWKPLKFYVWAVFTQNSLHHVIRCFFVI